MIILFYNVLLTILYPLVRIYLIFSPKQKRGSLAEKLGHYSLPHSLHDRPVIWIHAVSVGEVVCAGPLIRAWQKRHPDWNIVLSVTTIGGMEMARKLFPDGISVVHFPLDFIWIVRRAIHAISPTVFVIMETEIWPNMIMECARRRIPVYLLNSRVSDRMAAASAPVRAMYKAVFCRMAAIAPQSAGDEERLLRLGAPKEKVKLIGNLKFDDILPVDVSDDEPLKKILAADDVSLFVAGSTHPGEETQILEAFRVVRVDFPKLRLVLCPRHVERSEDVMNVVAADGWNAMYRSALKGDASPDVIVLDTIGELRRIYGFSTVCFVGGSLVERGGHNVLEPASSGRTAFFGPHMANFRSAVEILENAGGAIQVRDANDLALKVIEYLENDKKRKMSDAAALAAVQKNSGAALRACELIEKSLKSK